MKVFLWRGLAVTFTGTGVLGIFVPLLPTTVFFILAAWAGKLGWPELEARLLEHPKYGPSIIRWREHGIVPRKAKWAASATMTISLAFVWLGPVNRWVAIGVTMLLAAIATWLWTRPESPSTANSPDPHQLSAP